MYYGTKKIYSFLENGNSGGNTGDCNCEQEYQNGYNQGFQDGQNSCGAPVGPPSDCTLGTGAITLGSSDVGVVYELYASDDGYDGWSKFIVDTTDVTAGCPTTEIYDAYNAANKLRQGELNGLEGYVKGYVTEIKRTRPEYSDARYVIDNEFDVYNGQYNMDMGLELGDWVLVRGTFSLYNGQPQFNAGSIIIEQKRENTDGGSNPFAEYGYSDEDIVNMSSISKETSLNKLYEWDSSRDSAQEYFKEEEYGSLDGKRLVFAPMLDTSNVVNMNSMFYGCANLMYVPQYNTSNVTSMRGMFERSGIKFLPAFDTSNVQDMGSFLAECINLTSLPLLNFSNVNNLGEFFGYWNTVMSVANLGGFEGLKIDWNDGYGLNNCPNLTYESIMNVINGLYDFRGNGDNDTVKYLKIHQNTMSMLSEDDIQQATNKGWALTE